MSETVRYEILGPMRLLRGSQEVPLGGQQQRQMLALLIAASDRAVSMSRLIDAIWSENPPASARNSVQQYVHHLRGQIGDVLATEAGGYSLDTGGVVDSVEFEAQLDSARDMQPGQRAAALGDALDLWRGDAFVDFANCDWARPLASRLSELRTGAVEDRAEALILACQAVAALAVVGPHIDEHRLRDRPRGLLMRALAAQGRQPEALRAYQDYRKYLGDNIGTEPSSELQDLERKISTGWHDDVDAGSSVRRPGIERRHNLRSQQNTFIERPEVEQIVNVLDSRRLVTIVGPGGIGKTRCAVAVGHHIVDDLADGARWADGVWFVDLSTVVDDTTEAWRVVVEALGLQKAELSMRETVFEYVRTHRALLILDNCEHILDWVRDFTDDLLASTDATGVVATSRVRLDIAGEREFVLDPMSDDDGVLLFEARVAEAGSGPFPIEDSTDLCALLDNYPLAIELAAGRSRAMSAREISDRLRSHPGLLRSGSKHSLDRHATLAAALDWSLSQLSEESLRILQEAAIFGSDFDLSAAEAILGNAGETQLDVIDHLEILVEHHLINRDHLRARYRILEPIRQSLVVGAPHSDALIRGHGHHYLTLMADIGKGLLSPDEPIWWDRFEADVANIRDAFSWALRSGESALIETAMRWLPPSVHNLLFDQATDWAVEALNTLDVELSEIPATALTAAMGWHRLAGFNRSEEILTELEEGGIDQSLKSMLCLVRGTQQFMAGDPKKAVEWGGRCAEAAQADNDPVMLVAGRIAQFHPDAVDEADALGVPTLRAYSRFYAYGMMAEPTKLRSLDFVTDAYEASLASHNPFCIASGQTVMASVLLRLGDISKGASLMHEGAESMLRYRSHLLVRHVVETVANGLAGAGVSFPAAVLWAAMDASGAAGLARNLRNPALPAKVSADLTPAEETAAQGRGAELTIDQAAVFALETLEKLATD